MDAITITLWTERTEVPQAHRIQQAIKAAISDSQHQHFQSVASFISHLSSPSPWHYHGDPGPSLDQTVRYRC